jgi:hypothetical protein
VAGPSGGAAANLAINGVGDEHAYILFEVMFRKKCLEEKEEDKCSHVGPICLNSQHNGQTDGVDLRCLVSTDVWANPVINGFIRA